MLKWTFKFTSWPSVPNFLFVVLMEVLHTAGLAILCFMALPHLDSVSALLLTASLAVVPACLLLLSRRGFTVILRLTLLYNMLLFRLQENNERKFLLFWRGIQDEEEKESKNTQVKDDPGQSVREGRSVFTNCLLLVDLLAVLSQVSGAVVWCVLQYLDTEHQLDMQHPYPWSLPVAVILTSFGWWENFTEEDSWTSLGRFLWRMRKEMLVKEVKIKKKKSEYEDDPEDEYEIVKKPGTRHRVYTLVIPIKLVTFYISMILITVHTHIIQSPSQLTEFFTQSFGNHTYKVSTVQMGEIGGDYNDGVFEDQFYLLNDATKHAALVLLVQIFSGYLAYFAVKFASKVWIQSFSFAFPISLALPFTLLVVETMCGARAGDKCAFQTSSSFNIPNRLFFECPAMGDYFAYFWNNHTGIAVFWFLSYLWINLHIWYPKSPRLAKGEQLFCTPWYEGLFVEQSLVMNRRADGQKEGVDDKDDEEDIKRSEYVFIEDDRASSMKSSVKKSDAVTRIYACATMWHEEEDEMMEMLKSIFRIGKCTFN